MSESRTVSILQRVPVILAVTAASYGLTLPARYAAQGEASKTSAQQKAQPLDAAPAPVERLGFPPSRE